MLGKLPMRVSDPRKVGVAKAEPSSPTKTQPCVTGATSIMWAMT